MDVQLDFMRQVDTHPVTHATLLEMWPWGFLPL